MADFEEQLNAILGDQAAMGQIMALAQSLQKGTQAPPAGGAPDQTPEPAPDQPQTGAPPPVPAENPLAALENLDPRILSLGMKVWNEYQRGDDRNAALLAALRPFVREERWAKLDKAMQLARMARIIRTALGALGKGEEDHL